SSGVQVNNQCLEYYQDLKQNKKYRYIIYKLNPAQTEIVVEKSSESNDYDEFIDALPLNECRYAVYDVEYQHPEGGQRHKICFFAWAHDSAPIKDKVIYSSSKDALRRKLVGIATEIQATDASEIAFCVKI
ncbi:cofilin, partial [Coelomomyces lativittatus]